MAKKHCGHEDVCTECTKAEIAKLQKKIDALKKKLPEPQVIIREVEVEKKWPNLQPRWEDGKYFGAGPSNIVLCKGLNLNEQYGNNFNES